MTRLSILLALVSLAACGDPDCPEGSRLNESKSRCIPVDAGADATAGTDAGRDSGPDLDGGTDAGTPPCGAATDCSGNAPVCVDGTCLDCDADADGFHLGDSACDELRAESTADCDDARDDVYPGAPPVCGDGVINGCEELPADVATALDVEELQVSDTVVELFVGAPGDDIDRPSMVALQSSGGENNAAVATTYFRTGTRIAYLFAFDHTDPVATAPLEETVSTGTVTYFDTWQTSLTTATVLLTSLEGGAPEETPHFATLEPGFGSLAFTVAELDRASCPFEDVQRRDWSVSEDWWVFLGRDRSTTPTTFSLHAVDRSGTVACIGDLGAEGITIGDFPTLLAAGRVVFVNESITTANDVHVWKPLSSLSPLNEYAPGVAGDALVTTTASRYLLAAGYGGSAAVSDLDCNVASGCTELSLTVIPINGDSSLRRLARWGAGAALLYRFDNRPVEGSSRLAAGIEVRLVDRNGNSLGGDAFVMSLFEETHPEGELGSVSSYAATAVPRVPGGLESDLLVAFVRERSDTTETLELARIDGCVER